MFMFPKLAFYMSIVYFYAQRAFCNVVEGVTTVFWVLRKSVPYHEHSMLGSLFFRFHSEVQASSSFPGQQIL
jgi:hypothetical protein